MPTASIVIPSHGGVRRLPVILGSLAQQSCDDFETIVVLDGDIDGSAELVAEWSKTLPVRSVTFPHNRGRSAALNAGFDSATGEIFVRADDDLDLETGFVARHLDRHREAERGVIGMVKDIVTDTAYSRHYGVRTNTDLHRAAFATPPEMTWRFWGANVSVTAMDYHRVGGYDEEFRSYGWEDADWGYRLHQLGREILIDPGFTTLHCGPVTSVADKALRALHSGEAYGRFVAKHGPDADVAGTLPLTPWDMLVRAGALVSTERSLDRVGRLLDRHADGLPAPLAEKAMALTIQAASWAGHRYPRRARTHI